MWRVSQICHFDDNLLCTSGAESKISTTYAARQPPILILPVPSLPQRTYQRRIAVFRLFQYQIKRMADNRVTVGVNPAARLQSLCRHNGRGNW